MVFLTNNNNNNTISKKKNPFYFSIDTRTEIHYIDPGDQLGLISSTMKE